MTLIPTSSIHRPVLLIIMDGVGIGNQGEFDAVHRAKTPSLDNLYNANLFRTLKAHGTAVGMPSDADIGNSEVGHNTLGAGRVIDQGAKVVDDAIQSGRLFTGKAWQKALNQLAQNNSVLHLIGLLSDGNVHAHHHHLHALINEAARQGVKRCRVHSLLDGRDVAPQSALTYVRDLEAVLADNPYDYRIASGGGRMVITLDRYNADWDMVKRGWETHVLGEGPAFSSATEAIQHAYKQGDIQTDQDIPAFVIADSTGPIGKINDNDVVIMTHFRGDRAIEMSEAFESDTHFSHFDRRYVPNVMYLGMMQYDGDRHIPQHPLVEPVRVDDPVSRYWCDSHITTFALSETQKYGHVTYFWNGNSSGYINEDLETYCNIPSSNQPFNTQPAMQAHRITEQACAYIKSGHYGIGRVNFPNGDMVGHTGDLAATIQSIEVVDTCVDKLVRAMKAVNGITLILADHGNADDMGYRDQHNHVHVKTAHTRNPVPCCLVGAPNYRWRALETPGLSAVASTLCELHGYMAPEHYDKSLIVPC